jgi:hypothetical protein
MDVRMENGRWKPGVDDDADDARKSGVHDQPRGRQGNLSGGRAHVRRQGSVTSFISHA